jgi:hypothetical protein
LSVRVLFFRHVRDRWNYAFPPGSEWRDWVPETILLWGIVTLFITPLEVAIVVTSTIIYFQIKITFIIVSSSYTFLKEMLYFLLILNKEILKFLYLKSIEICVNVLAKNGILGLNCYKDGVKKKKIIPGVQFTKSRMIPDYFGFLLYQGPVIDIPLEKEFYDEVVEFIDKDNIKVFGNKVEVKLGSPFDIFITSTRYKMLLTKLNLISYICAYPLGACFFYFITLVVFGLCMTSELGKRFYLDEVYFTFGKTLKMVKTLIEQQAILQSTQYEQIVYFTYQNHYENFIQFLNKVLLVGYHLLQDGNGKFLEIFDKEFFFNLKQKLIHLYGSRTDPWFFPISPDATTPRFRPTTESSLTDEMCATAYYLFVEEKLKPSDYHFFRSAYQGPKVLTFWEKDWSFEKFDYFGNQISQYIYPFKLLKKPVNELFRVIRQESLTEYRYVIPDFLKPKGFQNITIKLLTEADVRSFLVENPVKEIGIDPNFFNIVRVELSQILPSWAHFKFIDLFTGEIYYFNRNDSTTIFFPEAYREDLFLKILPNIKFKAANERNFFKEVDLETLTEPALLQFFQKSQSPLLASFQELLQLVFGLTCYLPYQLFYVGLFNDNYPITMFITVLVLILFLLFYYYCYNSNNIFKRSVIFLKNIITLIISWCIILPIFIVIFFPIYYLFINIRKLVLNLFLLTTGEFKKEVNREHIQEIILKQDDLTLARNEKNIKERAREDRRLIIDLTYPNPKYYRDRDSLSAYRKQYIKRTKYPSKNVLLNILFDDQICIARCFIIRNIIGDFYTNLQE